MGNYWWLIIVIALIILGLLILIWLTWPSISDVKLEQRCRSAEYPTLAENVSDVPNVVEVTLTSSDNEVQILDGDLTKMYNYNHSFPGPLIEANVGDLLVVHFVNDISEPSTITFHGLMPNADQDGSIVAQRPVRPGDCYTYKIRLSRAGLFYYHSDVDARRQVSMGLFGAILVHDYHEDHRYHMPLVEKVLAFSDLKLDGNNQIDIDYSKDECSKALEQLNGIQGNVLLTNGVQNGCIHLPRDIPVRLRMLNASADRFLNISIRDHDMLKVGGDQGLASKPVLVKADHGLLLTPGERADVVFVPRTERVELVTQLNPRGTQKVVSDDGYCEIENEVTKDLEQAVLVTFDTRPEPEQKLEVPLELAPIRKIRVDHCTPVIPVTYGRYPPDCEGNIEYYAVRECGEGIPFDSLTAKQAPLVFEDGTYIIEVSNYSDLANNFHLHGFSFQHLDTWSLSKKGKTRTVNPVLENKDTILIPPRPAQESKAKTVVRLAVEFKRNNIIAYGGEPRNKHSGGWVFQSHLLTNAELGQAGYIQIVAECHRERFLDISVNTYSDYSTGDHTTCLTRSSSIDGRYSDSSNRSRDSASWKRSSRRSSSSEWRRSSHSEWRRSSHSEWRQNSSDLDELTDSLVVCSCGSGLSSSLCSCSHNSKKDFLESRLRRNTSSSTY